MTLIKLKENMAKLKKPIFKVGDLIRSAQGSSDIKQMKMIWRGKVQYRREAPEIGTPDDHVYTTLGFWYNLDGGRPDRSRKPKSRQLWARSLELDPSSTCTP